MTAGDARPFDITVYEADAVAARDLTGAVLSVVVRQWRPPGEPRSFPPPGGQPLAQPLFTLSSSTGEVVVASPPTLGKAVATFAPALTASLASQRLQCQVVLQDSGGPQTVALFYVDVEQLAEAPCPC